MTEYYKSYLEINSLRDPAHYHSTILINNALGSSIIRV